MAITDAFIKRQRHWFTVLSATMGLRTALYLVELLVQRSGYDFVEGVIADTIVSVARSETGYEDLAE